MMEVAQNYGGDINLELSFQQLVMFQNMNSFVMSHDLMREIIVS